MRIRFFSFTTVYAFASAQLSFVFAPYIEKSAPATELGSKRRIRQPTGSRNSRSVLLAGVAFLFDASLLTHEIAEVEQASATDITATGDFNAN